VPGADRKRFRRTSSPAPYPDSRKPVAVAGSRSRVRDQFRTRAFPVCRGCRSSTGRGFAEPAARKLARRDENRPARGPRATARANCRKRADRPRLQLGRRIALRTGPGNAADEFGPLAGSELRLGRDAPGSSSRRTRRADAEAFAPRRDRFAAPPRIDLRGLPSGVPGRKTPNPGRAEIRLAVGDGSGIRVGRPGFRQRQRSGEVGGGFRRRFQNRVRPIRTSESAGFAPGQDATTRRPGGRRAPCPVSAAPRESGVPPPGLPPASKRVVENHARRITPPPHPERPRSRQRSSASAAPRVERQRLFAVNPPRTALRRRFRPVPEVIAERASRELGGLDQ
jgi:hypothetical protein